MCSERECADVCSRTLNEPRRRPHLLQRLLEVAVDLLASRTRDPNALVELLPQHIQGDHKLRAQHTGRRGRVESLRTGLARDDASDQHSDNLKGNCAVANQHNEHGASRMSGSIEFAAAQNNAIIGML